ncbi:agmatinase [Methanobacterium petrolearium]|uniref:agmatinase n=1 Tax=Methanobacterium petrolearium TaxID=710190 RepID=UPI001AE5ACF2|nr:agmatinase [Methanobacterium petrolearium]MBP1946387.1 agmatinase [Methanobacterium petrolearium]BDZ70589.1 agmatinase [Methanobacterium petrolearium]
MYLYTENPLKFAFSQDFEEFKEKDSPCFGILGVPFDSTTSYLPGARFGPFFVREASYNFEKYNLLSDTVLDINLCDVGNLEVVPGNLENTYMHLESVVSSMSEDTLTPLTIGGEHGISYGVINALNTQNNLQDVTILHFDAHMDLRDDYVGEKYSHATVMRRIYDKNPAKIIQMGIRSSSPGEAEFARKNGIDFYTAHDIKKDLKGIEKVINQIDGPIYVTVDIDVLDPAYAPSVGTPSPCGINTQELESLISHLKGKEIIGFDVVEVSSTSIGDITSINAAKIILDFLFLQ